MLVLAFFDIEWQKLKDMIKHKYQQIIVIGLKVAKPQPAVDIKDL